MDRLVVCAAMRNRASGLVICGARHFDRHMHAAINGSYLPWRRRKQHWEQGFIDNMGVFMTREEALAVARAAGQIRRRCGGEDYRLYLENLY